MIRCKIGSGTIYLRSFVPTLGLSTLPDRESSKASLFSPVFFFFFPFFVTFRTYSDCICKKITRICHPYRVIRNRSLPLAYLGRFSSQRGHPNQVHHCYYDQHNLSYYWRQPRNWPWPGREIPLSFQHHRHRGRPRARRCLIPVPAIPPQGRVLSPGRGEGRL